MVETFNSLDPQGRLLACLASTSEQAGQDARLPETESEWTEFLVQAARHALLPLVYHRLSAREAIPGLNEGALRSLRETYLMNGARNAMMALDLASVLNALERESIQVIVLKGAYLAEAVYSDRALRTMNDIDLLVRRPDLERAASKLRNLGYAAEREPRDIEQLCAKQRHWPRMYKPPGMGIELHWTLASPPQFPHISPAGLWERSRTVVIAGTNTRMLSVEDLLLHLSLHTGEDGSGPFNLGLRPLCDIAATVARFQEEISWSQLRNRAEVWHVEGHALPRPLAVKDASRRAHSRAHTLLAPSGPLPAAMGQLGHQPGCQERRRTVAGGRPSRLPVL